MADVSLEMLMTMMQRVIDTQREHTHSFQEMRQGLGYLEGMYATLSRRSDVIVADVSLIKRQLDLVDH